LKNIKNENFEKKFKFNREEMGRRTISEEQVDSFIAKGSLGNKFSSGTSRFL
jgi:hypothetical protein